MDVGQCLVSAEAGFKESASVAMVSNYIYVPEFDIILNIRIWQTGLSSLSPTIGCIDKEKWCAILKDADCKDENHKEACPKTCNACASKSYALGFKWNFSQTTRTMDF